MRILIVSDSPTLKTGFGRVGQNVAEALSEAGHEVAYQGWFHRDVDIDRKYTIFTTLRSHQKCCQNGSFIHELTPEGGCNYYALNNQGTHMFEFEEGLECKTTGVPMDRRDNYGALSYPAICNHWKPQLCVMIGDVWMIYHASTGWNTREGVGNQIRNSYKLIFYTPTDGAPLPRASEFEGVRVDWAKTFSDADIPMGFCKWGMDEMNKMIGSDRVKHFIPHGVDNSIFKPADSETRRRMRLYRFGLRDEFLIGTVCRNIPRKNLPGLLSFVKTFKDRGLEKDREVKVYLHALRRDHGWDLGDLVKQYGAEDWVILNETLGIGIGPDDNEMAEIYNCMDSHIILSAGEGWNLPYLESIACGIPTVAIDYSAHADWGRLDGKPGLMYVKPTAMTQEPVTNIGRAQVSDDAVIEVFSKVYDGDPEVQATIDTGLQIAQNLDWKNVRRQWVDVVDKEIDVSTGLEPYKEPAEGERVIKMEDLLNPRDSMRILVSMPEAAGDVLLMTGVVRALKQKYPFSSIYFATSKPYFELLKDCTEVTKVIPYDDYLLDYMQLREHFALIYTPHYYTQRYANWVHGGLGGHLIDVYARNCDVSPLDPYIGREKLKDVELPPAYITLHVTSGQRQWQLRWYKRWPEVVDRIKLPIVQVGSADDSPIPGITLDLRGKTNFQQLAYVIGEAVCHVGADSLCSHIASTVDTRSVVLFPNNYPQSTGPLKGGISILPRSRHGECTGPCLSLQCMYGGNRTCLDFVEPDRIVGAIGEIIGFEYIK